MKPQTFFNILGRHLMLTLLWMMPPLLAEPRWWVPKRDTICFTTSPPPNKRKRPDPYHMIVNPSGLTNTHLSGLGFAPQGLSASMHMQQPSPLLMPFMPMMQGARPLALTLVLMILISSPSMNIPATHPEVPGNGWDFGIVKKKTQAEK
jgi:hypothetical protein